MKKTQENVERELENIWVSLVSRINRASDTYTMNSVSIAMSDIGGVPSDDVLETMRERLETAGWAVKSNFDTQGEMYWHVSPKQE